MTKNEWLLILGMMGVTFGVRYFLFALADRIRVPALMESSLRYIPPAVLTAITLPAVLLPRGEWHVSPTNPYLVAAIAATAVGAFTKNLLATIAVGLAAFFGWRLLLASLL
ncbi:AzlD domain-containing protein [Desulfococcus sp.]|jgi:branched-subunit amino acid transport protein|uniref:AzlD domain-containing protein n=1 Tax=Desulfococcus sp. TaxID=2025834 RepID=UPI003593E8D2